MIDHTNVLSSIFNVWSRYIEDDDYLGAVTYMQFLAAALAYQYIHKNLDVPMEELISRSIANERRQRASSGNN